MTSARLPTLSLAGLLLAVHPAAAGEPNPECAFSEGFVASDLSSRPLAMAVWDDGTGEALYAGGSFFAAGGREVGFVARWDGTSWSPLTGSFGSGTNHWAWDLEVYDDGSGEALYVAGEFREAGGVPVEAIARWDGSEWSALPDGGPFVITELEVFDDGSGPVLVAGGIGGVSAWDGSAWTTLGAFDQTRLFSVYAMTTWDDGSGPALYVGGAFESVGGVAAAYLARWDGSTWSAVHGPGGASPDSWVRALRVFDDGTGPALYAGGSFTRIGGIETGLARWDGTAWSLVGAVETLPIVHALAVHDDGMGPALWIGGIFSSLGGVPARRIARWDGQTFSEPAGGADGAVYTIISWADGPGDALYVGGDMTEAGGTGVGHVSRLAGGSWGRLGAAEGDGMNSTVLDFAVYDDGTGRSLYAAGDFTLASGSEAFHVARWAGTAWAPVGAPGARLGGRADALEVFDDGRGPALYVGGFLTLGGEPVPSLARWDGVAWSLVEPAAPLEKHFSGFVIRGEVHTLRAFDDGTGEALYVGGDFSHVGDQEVNDVARWDGSSWSGLEGGVGGGNGVYTFEVWDDGGGPALYMGGSFGGEVGGVETVMSIARWDGSGWSALGPTGGSAPGGTVFALEAFDDGTGSALYVGGDLGANSSPHFENIARWDGSSWQPLGSSPGAGVWGAGVWALEVFDDGGGPALYVGGDFDYADFPAIDAQNVARWDGTGWTPLHGPGGPGTVGPVRALAADPDRSALWVGGDLVQAGGLPAHHLARWTCGEVEQPALQIDFVPLF